MRGELLGIRIEQLLQLVLDRLETIVNAVLGIYARESGEGMVFSDEAPEGEGSVPDGDPEAPPPAPKPPDPPKKRPALKVVK